MVFVNWGLLWLLPLAAIPILLHLLTLYRLRTVELSTYRFLFDSYVQQRRRMQFLEALLAILRTLFLLLLVLVVARPMVRHWNDLFQAGSGGREVILLMDCSASMNAQTAGVSAFDRAKSAARAVVKRLQPEDRVTLIRVASKSEELFSRFTTDAAGIEERIDGLTTTPARANYFAAFTHLFGPEAPKRTNPVVYLFTDCQASGWREVRNQGIDRILPPETPLVMVSVGSNEAMPNQAVVGDAPRRHRAVAGLPVHLTARVVNYAKESAEVTLNTFLDEKEIAHHKLALKPGETVAKKMIYTPSEPGTHRGRFQITGNTADRFPGDDSYLFTLSVIPRVKVLLVNGNPSPDPELNETLYLRALSDIFANSSDASLAPLKGKEEGSKKPNPLGGLRDLARSLDLREVPEAILTEATLKDASVVVLANCGGLNATHFTLLRSFVAAGGGLLIFPGDKVNPQIYNTQFFPVPGVPGEMLTPVLLGPVQGDPTKLETFERLASLDFSHPVLSVFDDPKREVPYFKRVLFYKRFPLKVADKQAKVWPLAEFTSGALALVENQYGDGLVVVAAFPINRSWSNLPTENGKEFVPLALRLISRVQHRAEVEAPSAVMPGGVAELSVTGAWNPAVGKVTDPAGRSTPIALERSGSRLLGAFERTGERGYYTIDVRNEAATQDQGGNLDFAVNMAPEESDFTALDKEQLQQLLPGAEITFIDASAEAQQLHGTIGNEQEIWRPLIYLVFVIIGVEFLLATLGGQKKETDDGPEVPERVRSFHPGAWLGRMVGAARKKAE